MTNFIGVFRFETSLSTFNTKPTCGEKLQIVDFKNSGRFNYSKSKNFGCDKVCFINAESRCRNRAYDLAESFGRINKFHELCGNVLQSFCADSIKYSPSKVKLIDQFRAVASAKHLSHRKEDTHHNFITRCILFHDKRYPKEIGTEEISSFTTHLAVHDKVSASK